MNRIKAGTVIRVGLVVDQPSNRQPSASTNKQTFVPVAARCNSSVELGLVSADLPQLPSYSCACVVVSSFFTKAGSSENLQPSDQELGRL